LRLDHQATLFLLLNKPLFCLIHLMYTPLTQV
jgi:hypothetical protein